MVAVATKTPAATAMAGAQTANNNQLKAIAATVTGTATMKATTTTMKTKVVAAAVAAWPQRSSGSSLAAAARRQWAAQQQCGQRSHGGQLGSDGSVAVAASLGLVAAWWRQPAWPWRQRSISGGSSTVGSAVAAWLWWRQQ